MFQEAGVENDEEEHDFQMRMATAMLLSCSEEPSVVDSRHQSAMPSDLVLKNISPNGWCFYDCVREHLHLSSEAPESSISTSSIAVLCLTCLALRREEFCDFLKDSEATRAQRRENVFKHRQFLKWCEQLDDFQIYILDKLEVAFTSTNVLDTLHYADSPEIEAILRCFHLSMLRLRPFNEWTRRHQDIGFFQGINENVITETIASEEHLRSLLNEKHFDLQLVHSQRLGCRPCKSTKTSLFATVWPSIV